MARVGSLQEARAPAIIRISVGQWRCCPGFASHASISGDIRRQVRPEKFLGLKLAVKTAGTFSSRIRSGYSAHKRRTSQLNRKVATRCRPVDQTAAFAQVAVTHLLVFGRKAWPPKLLLRAKKS
eukprot:GHVT01025902.1.p1 GENE.GHVT01025902.1~~GHVT01025902.1.p1  ORF type:complete len:124 (-),score=11.44 GHVT01025902.1:1491-1862(-)